MRSPFLYRSQTPVTLAGAAWVISALPALGTLFMVVAYVASFLSGTGATMEQVLTFAPLLLPITGAACAYVALLRSSTTRRAWLFSSLTMVLLLIGAAPVTISFGQAFLGEWCEGAPGGRGWSGGIGSPDEVPLLCR